ncbi:hypothetical protein [Saccharococcus caldoxylosilyticus]|uniref:Uncharacterized protein n=1 Tax=Saccharococcus caldoxylosilyticus TaxID=81408 RepID=A0A150LVK3_9BACL|nr:hypothetical protein [Parageobacillus caldoxylosilyticus]KYD16211.1 hypothetical protein B4119_2347 [Parageobacillus caldoxylosilyticus]
MQGENFCKKFDEWFSTFRLSLLAYWTDGSLAESTSAEQTIS